MFDDIRVLVLLDHSDQYNHQFEDVSFRRKKRMRKKIKQRLKKVPLTLNMKEWTGSELFLLLLLLLDWLVVP